MINIRIVFICGLVFIRYKGPIMTNESKPTDDQPTSKGRQGARWGQERRLEFIDYRLRWDGQINRSSLTDFFGISVPPVSYTHLDVYKRQRYG